MAFSVKANNSKQSIMVELETNHQVESIGMDLKS